MLHGWLSLLVVQTIAFPGDVVVRVHDAADGIKDEEQQENEPIRCVIVARSLHICLYESGQAYYCIDLKAALASF